MQLFSLPFVPLKEVLDNLDLNSLLFLSLCSKRTKNFIVQTQKYAFQKIDYVEYWANAQVVSIKVKTCSGQPTLMIYLFDTRMFIMEEKFEFIRLNELGTPIDVFRCPTNPKIRRDLQVKYCSVDASSIIDTVLNHLRSLLGNHYKYRVTGQYPDSTLLPRLGNVEMCHLRVVKNLESTEIDEFLSRSPCLEYCMLMIFNDQKNFTLGESSRLYELDTVHLWTQSVLAQDFMQRFNGRHAFVFGGTVTTTDVIQFLNAWKSGEKFRNLEVMSVDIALQIPEIRDAVELREVNTEVEYAFVRKFSERLPYSSFRFSWELRSRFYMVRESDGHVATVKLTRERFFMGVWNMKEAEYLEKFHDSEDPALGRGGEEAEAADEN